MSKEIVFTKKDLAEFLDFTPDKPGENQVTVKTVFSSISCGTEKANITGDANVTPFTAIQPVVFPRRAGYSSSGIVIAKGDKVTSVQIGDRVAMTWSQHKSINIIDERNIIRLEDERITMQDAALAHICTFPLAALRKTKLEIGESFLVMGLGILGLFAVQLAKAAGAVPIIAVDPVAERREKALRFGADFALDPTEDGFAEKVKQLTDGGANAAIEVTGLGIGLDQCLDCMAHFGRVALLGCTRDKNFTIDYYRKIHGPGIKIIGAHTLARPELESSPGMFTCRDDIKSVLKLCAAGRMSLKNTVDAVYSPKDCTEVYSRLISDKNFPVVSQFDWSEI